MILCPDTDLEGACTCGERVRQRVASQPIEVPGFAGTITVSLGAAVARDAMHSPDDLLRAADRAVYRAKRGGRNRLCRAEGDRVEALLVPASQPGS